MCLAYTVFRYSNFFGKNHKLFLAHMYLAPPLLLGMANWNITKTLFGIRKLESPGYHVALSALQYL